MASLDQRLNQFLSSNSELPPTEPVGDLPLEPRPAEPQETMFDVDPNAEPGMPNMDGTQVAGVTGMLRKLITKGEAKAVRKAAGEAAPAVDNAAAAAAKIAPEVKPVPPVATPKPAKVRASAKAAPGTGKPSTGEAFNYDLFDDQSVAKYVQGLAKDTALDVNRITKDEVLQQVNALGFDDAYLRGLDGQAKELKDLPATVLRAAFAVPSQIKRLEVLAERIAKEGETPELMQQFLEQYALSAHVIKQAKAIQSAPAQALAVLNQGRPVVNIDALKNMASDPNVSNGIKEVATAITQMTDDASKAQLIDKVSKVGLVKDLWFSTYINGLLSSPVSHAKNIVSNTAFGLYQIPERMVAALYSNVLPKNVRSWRSLVPGSADEKIGFDEALTMVMSLRNGLAEGFEVAGKAFRTNEPVMDAANKLEINARMTMGETLQTLTGAPKDSAFGKALDYYGTAVTLPSRALLTEDEFFKAVLYRMELNTQVTRRAKSVYRDAVDSGLPEADALAKAESEATALMKNPPQDLDDAAMEFARRGTFTADLPPMLEKLQDTFNHPALKIFVPFFKTPANIGLEVIERTPFAPLLSSRFRSEFAAGGIYRDMALAKVTLGTSILGTFALLAQEGQITGSGPGRKPQREAMMRDGWQPYSLKIGDKYYSYAGMEPLSALLAIAADYAEYAINEPDKGKVEQVFLGATYGLYEYLKEQPYLQGVAEITKALGLGRQGGEVDGAKLVDNIARQLGGFAIGGSPAGAYSSLVAGIERILDPTARDTRASPDMPMGVRGFYEAFNKYRSRLPYGSDAVPESLNLWGDPIQQGRGNPLEIVLPTRVSPQQFSEVDDALVRMGSPVGMPQRKMDGIELSAQQYNRLLTIYGKETPAKDQILETIRTPGFDLLTLDDQQKYVQRVHSKFMDLARKQLISEDPTLAMKLEELQEMRKANGLYYKPD